MPRQIDLSAPKIRHTVFSYGDTRTGKTRFAGTWPKPVFLSEASEGGWSTLQVMTDADLYESGVMPIVFAIESIADLNEAIAVSVPKLIAEGLCHTVVIDSLTFITDLFMARLQTSKDPRQDYQALQTYLRVLRVNAHALPVNVLWLGLAQAPGATDDGGITPGMPLMAGSKNAPRFVAGADNILYHRTQPIQGGVNYEIRTRSFGKYLAGSRWPLPDPLGYIDDNDKFVVSSTYRDFQAAIDAAEQARESA